MPQAARKTDLGSAHDCHFPPSAAIEGSDDVFINGLPAMRVGDAYEPHSCSTCPKPPHGRTLARGSATVNINNRPAGRVGDAIDCGGFHETGSPNVFIGDDSYGSDDAYARPKFSFILSEYSADHTHGYANEPYQLYLNGVLIKKGRTGLDGLIEFEAEGDTITGDLVVKAALTQWNITLSALSPADSEIGFDQRLSTLGYDNHNETVAPQHEPPLIAPHYGHFQTLKGEAIANKPSEKVTLLMKSQMP